MAMVSMCVRIPLLLLLLAGKTSLISASARIPPELKLYAKPQSHSLDSDRLQLLYINPHHNIVFNGPIQLRDGGTTNEVVLECTAPYPIRWRYIGDGWGPDSPERITGSRALKNVTITSDQRSESEYKVTITGLYLYERVTGQYICEQHTGQGQQDTRNGHGSILSSTIYLTVPYNSPRSGPDSAPSTLPLRTFLRYTEPGSPIQVHLREGDIGSRVVIPCSVSDAAADVRLYKVDDHGRQEQELPVKFDPKTGFVLVLDQTQTRLQLSGEYVCRISAGNWNPNVESKELRVRVSKESEPEPTPASRSRDWTMSRSRSSSPLRSQSGATFAYNAATRELSCTGLDGGDQDHEQESLPVLEKIDCGPELECFFREWYYLGRGHRHMSGGKNNVIRLPYSSILEEGWLKCSPNPTSGSWKAITVRFVLDVHSGDLYLQEQGQQVSGAPFGISILGKEEITLPELDELVIRPRNEVQLDEELHLYCYRSRSEFTTGHGSFRWWVSRRQTQNQLVQENLDECINAECKIRIRAMDLDLASIHCSAPQLTSAAGSPSPISTAPIHVKGPTEPPNIKLAFVRDNQDFEQIGDGNGDRDAEEVHASSSAGSSATYYNKTYKGYRFTASDFGTHGQTLYVQCRASYPVEWTYSGYFAPEIMSTTQRYMPPSQIEGDIFNDQTSYYFITEVIIRVHKVDYTGEYICRKISDHRARTTNVYLYFADPDNVFLPQPAETSRIQYAASSPAQQQLTSSAARRRSRFFVHCPVSDPLQPVILQKLDPETKTWIQPTMAHKLRFNSKFGFELYPDSDSDLDIVGTYACSSNIGRLQVSEPTHVRGDSRIEETGPLAPARFSVTPRDTRVSLDPPRVQVLVCESHEEVTLLFSDPKLRKTLVISRNATGNTSYKYSALAIIETFKQRRDSFTTIECVHVAAPDRILHKWRLTNKQPGQISKFTYDNQTRSYVCCGSRGGYLKPQISVATTGPGGCHSVTECRLQACLKNSKCARSVNVNPNQHQRRAKPVEIETEGEGEDSTCTEMRVDAVPTEGMLLCDLGVGDVPYLSFSYLLYHRDPETGAEIHTRFWNMNTDVIRGEGSGGAAAEGDGDNSSTSTILKIRRVRTSRSHRLGSGEKFVCEGSRFFFSLGFYWVLERGEGSGSGSEPEYVTGVDKMSGSSAFGSEYYKSSLVLEPDQLAGVKTVRCVAPEWNSYRWQTASIRI